MSQVLFQDVINACLGELLSISATESGKTNIYVLLVANSTSSNILPLITTLDLSSFPGIMHNFSFFVANVLSKMVSLTSLDLRNNLLGAADVRSLAESTSLPNLASLNLSSNQIGEDGARAIAESKALTNLTSLDLSSIYIGDNGVHFLAKSTTLSNLTSLDLNKNKIVRDGTRFLAESTTLTNLTSLDLSNNYISAHPSPFD